MKNKTMLVALLVVLGAVGTPRAQQPSNSEGKVETGQVNGAAFRIDVPAMWNKGLVMYCLNTTFPER